MSEKMGIVAHGEERERDRKPCSPGNFAVEAFVTKPISANKPVPLCSYYY